MQIINIIREEIEKWYHGTPDSREIKKSGFAQRTDTTQYVEDPVKWNEMQVQMDAARAQGNEDLYFDLLNKRSVMHKTLQYKKPIYFTKNARVAGTYADPWRSLDYQNAEPNVFTAEIDDSGKKLTINAHGENFRGIKTDIVKSALMADGVNENQIDHMFGMFMNWIRDGKMSAETLGIIAQLLKYDVVDVVNVMDNYEGKGPRTTVRMIFDPQRIKMD